MAAPVPALPSTYSELEDTVDAMHRHTWTRHARHNGHVIARLDHLIRAKLPEVAREDGISGPGEVVLSRAELDAVLQKLGAELERSLDKCRAGARAQAVLDALQPDAAATGGAGWPVRRLESLVARLARIRQGPGRPTSPASPTSPTLAGVPAARRASVVRVQAMGLAANGRRQSVVTVSGAGLGGAQLAPMGELDGPRRVEYVSGRRMEHAGHRYVYNGDLGADGLRHGRGTLATEDDDPVPRSFSGEWCNGQPHGIGVLTCAVSAPRGCPASLGTYTGEIRLTPVGLLPDGLGVWRSDTSDDYRAGRWADGTLLPGHVESALGGSVRYVPTEPTTSSDDRSGSTEEADQLPAGGGGVEWLLWADGHALRICAPGDSTLHLPGGLQLSASTWCLHENVCPPPMRPAAAVPCRAAWPGRGCPAPSWPLAEDPAVGGIGDYVHLGRPVERWGAQLTEGSAAVCLRAVHGPGGTACRHPLRLRVAWLVCDLQAAASVLGRIGGQLVATLSDLVFPLFSLFYAEEDIQLCAQYSRLASTSAALLGIPGTLWGPLAVPSPPSLPARSPSSPSSPSAAAAAACDTADAAAAPTGPSAPRSPAPRHRRPQSADFSTRSIHLLGSLPAAGGSGRRRRNSSLGRRPRAAAAAAAAVERPARPVPTWATCDRTPCVCCTVVSPPAVFGTPYWAAVQQLRATFAGEAAGPEAQLAGIVRVSELVTQAVPSSVLIGADDKMPLLIYIVLCARLPHLCSRLRLLRRCCPPALLTDVHDYRLLELEGAVALARQLRADMRDADGCVCAVGIPATVIAGRLLNLPASSRRVLSVWLAAILQKLCAQPAADGTAAGGDSTPVWAVPHHTMAVTELRGAAESVLGQLGLRIGAADLAPVACLCANSGPGRVVGAVELLYVARALPGDAYATAMGALHLLGREGN